MQAKLAILRRLKTFFSLNILGGRGVLSVASHHKKNDVIQIFIARIAKNIFSCWSESLMLSYAIIFSLYLLTLCQQTDNSPRYLIYIPFTGSHHTQKDITPTVARRANYHTKCTPTLLYKSKDKTLSLLKKHLILGVGEFIIILPLLRYITIR